MSITVECRLGRETDALFITAETSAIGNNLEEMIALSGEDVTYSNAKANMVVRAQGYMRGLVRGGKTSAGLSPEEAVAKFQSDWKPGMVIRAPKRSIKEQADSFLSSMTPQEQLEYIKELNAKAAEGVAESPVAETEPETSPKKKK